MYTYSHDTSNALVALMCALVSTHICVCADDRSANAEVNKSQFSVGIFEWFKAMAATATNAIDAQIEGFVHKLLVISFDF